MTAAATDEAARVAELEAQVEALERLLAERSRELRILQGRLCTRDLMELERLASGEWLATSVPAAWSESVELTAIEVETALDLLWTEVDRERRRDEEST